MESAAGKCCPTKNSPNCHTLRPPCVKPQGLLALQLNRKKKESDTATPAYGSCINTFLRLLVVNLACAFLGEWAGKQQGGEALCNFA